eukprot:scaffold4936_cov165-Amphora_coffeaeformis.AAC.1
MLVDNNEVIPIANSNIEQPTALDCLCGKDTTFGRHPGNRMFRKKILASLPQFIAAKNKPEKMKMTKSILDFMKKKCSRFLKLGDNGSWVEIDRQTARDKVSHALRFAARQQKSPHRDDDDSQTRASPEIAEQDESPFDPIPYSRLSAGSEFFVAAHLPTTGDEDECKHTEKAVLPNLFRGFCPIHEFVSLGPLSKQDTRRDSTGVLQGFDDDRYFDVDEVFAREVLELIAL